jgi:glucose/mannose-6-phosphate isomerase
MLEAIKKFPQQFLYEPVILNADKVSGFQKFVVVGVGGSRLPALILKAWKPSLQLTIHNDYGLPALPEAELRESLIIASSYSGNTEEVLDAYDLARSRRYAVAAVTVGGKLLEQAKRDGVPYVQLPDWGIQPRAALGFATRALLRFFGETGALQDTAALGRILDSNASEAQGKRIAQVLRGYVPVIYSSARNYAIAYNWKIKFNETGKIPAFCGMLPELNHNEMTGFDVAPATANLSKPFYFVFLRDATDGSRMSRRISVLERLYKERGLPVITLDLDEGRGFFHKLFSSLLLADWAAYHTARAYGRDPEKVPMVEEFKRIMGSDNDLTS